MSDDAPGWQPDPTGRHDHRYWDGTRWTDNVADAGVAGTDPFDGPTSPTPPVPPAPAAPVEPGDPSPTVSMGVPASDPTASWPTVPPTPSPGAPAGGASGAGPVSSGAGGGGSKKGFIIGGGILVIIAVVVAVLALGGGDDDDDDGDRIRGGLASILQDEADLSAGDSRCVADFIVDDLGEDRLADVDFDADQPPAEIADDYVEAMGRGMLDCEVSGRDLDDVDDTGDADDADDADAGTTDDAPDDSTDGDGDVGDLGDIDDLPADFREQMAQQFEQTLGLSPDKADCLAGRMFEVVESGALDEEDAMADFMAYLSDCDINIGELSPN